jgi:predicted transcriptional regulator
MKERVAEIVAAYVGHNTVAPDQLPSLIASVDAALSSLGQSPVPAAVPTPGPAVSVRRSIGPDQITCLTCGWSGQMLKRHLSTAHGMTPAQYRERWKLASDYPMVAPNYATRRSELAKSIGLGTRGKGRRRR